MTALDQAFIKAYTDQGSEPGTPGGGSLKPLRLDEALRDHSFPADRHASSPAVEETPGRILKGPRPQAAKRSLAGTKPPVHQPGLGETETGRPERGPCGVECATAARAAAEEKTVFHPLAEMAPSEPAIPPPKPACATTSGQTVAGSAGQPFRPAWQVESFAWPTTTQRLWREAGDEVDRLADHLLQGRTRGHKVVGVAGCQRGEGCTTTLLAVAWRLAERGLAVALVDADFDQPRLAAALGLTPEMGWEDVFDGKLPLREVAIESQRDGMMLVPLRDAESALSDSPGDPAADLKCLRAHADLVLVDLAEFPGGSTRARRLRAAAVQAVDAAVLVHNVRRGSSAGLDQSIARISAAGIHLAGVAENFV
jgi:Mrp family chromosome partitioning ATPase